MKDGPLKDFVRREIVQRDAEKKPMTHDEHRAVHVVLHRHFDELLADFIEHHPGCLPMTGGTLVRELVEWSYQQTIDPTEV